MSSEPTTVHHFRIDGLLGAGGMGTVYRATDLRTNTPVALKTMHAETAQNPLYKKRFYREAKAAMAAQHPNIVRILEVFENEGTPWLSMEVLHGENLEAMLERRGRLRLDELAPILLRVVSAVGSAHALGIVHRDLKPDNVFLVHGTGETDVKVLDFGIAKLTAAGGATAETAALTRTGALMGTPFYMSPEQAFGEKRIDHRSDIWSLGIMAYRCLTGVLPTKADSFAEVFKHVVQTPFQPIAELCPELPADVTDLVTRMLERDPAKRPWDLSEVFAALSRHAPDAVPSFGRAVEPVFEEMSQDQSPPAAPPAASSSSVSPMRFTPKGLGSIPVGQRPTGTTPRGTLALDPAASPSSPAAQPTPRASPALEDSINLPRSIGVAPWAIAVVVALLAAAAFVAWKIGG